MGPLGGPRWSARLGWAHGMSPGGRLPVFKVFSLWECSCVLCRRQSWHPFLWSGLGGPYLHKGMCYTMGSLLLSLLPVALTETDVEWVYLLRRG
jgi:hypothetical protein